MTDPAMTELPAMTDLAAMTDLTALRERIRAHDKLVVAYSGGVDSALVAVVAHQELGERALAVTAVSPSLPERERRHARRFAAEHGFAHLEATTREQDDPAYTANGADRCYHCKSALFDALDPLAALSGARIALGTNLDDLGDHRPGQAAARERGAIAPLVEAGLGKAAVRAASRELGLGTAEKPAAACLSSRIAYGDPVRPEVLAAVERTEDALHALGFPVCRVRAHADGTVARVELPADELPRALAHRSEVDTAAREAGFSFCALDLAGFASGRMNALLPLTPVSR